MPYTVGDAVNYPTAVGICESYGEKLAEITDNESFNKVYDYLMKTWKGSSYVEVWLDMKYQVNKEVIMW